jgi:hypothetical protein
VWKLGIFLGLGLDWERGGERDKRMRKGNGESKWEWSFGLWWDQKEGETVVVVCLLGLVVG